MSEYGCLWVGVWVSVWVFVGCLGVVSGCVGVSVCRCLWVCGCWRVCWVCGCLGEWVWVWVGVESVGVWVGV